MCGWVTFFKYSFLRNRLQRITLKFSVKMRSAVVFGFMESVCLKGEVEFFLFYANEAKCNQKDPLI